MAIAYLNGAWLAPEQARISVHDRGFMFGDGIYEVIAVYNGAVFALDEHLARLRCSLAAIRLDSPLGDPVEDNAWRELIQEAVARGNEQTAFLYLQVTRGLSMPRSHQYADDLTPTLLITVTHAPILERQTVTPYKMITKQDFRWGRGDIKTVSLIANVMLKNEAIAEGYDDAILIRDGLVTEATSANVFVVHDGVIATPPADNYLLHGITRAHILKLAEGAGMPVAERKVTRQELATADEVWIASTGHEVWPVAEVDGQVLGGGEMPGDVWRVVDDLFQASKVGATLDAGMNTDLKNDPARKSLPA